MSNVESSETRVESILTPETGAGVGKAQESPDHERVVQVFRHALDVFGNPEKAVLWLNQSNRALGDRPPRALLSDSAGLDEVETLLGRIEYGVYS